MALISKCILNYCQIRLRKPLLAISKKAFVRVLLHLQDKALQLQKWAFPGVAKRLIEDWFAVLQFNNYKIMIITKGVEYKVGLKLKYKSVCVAICSLAITLSSRVS